MDAPEDRDILLIKSHTVLLEQALQILPTLLRDEDGEPTTSCKPTEVEKLIACLEAFQESPQLLDPNLSAFLSPLTDAFVAYLSSSAYTAPKRPPPSPNPIPSTDYPLPVAIARIVYTLVKIRGQKVISRFLPNEPRNLELVSSVFAHPSTGVEDSWELRYVLLLWLSHLLLAPFDLSTISSDNSQEDFQALEKTGLDVPGLPNLSRRLLVLVVTHIASPGNRESEAAALLLVRLCLRRDMRTLGLLDATVAWASAAITDAIAIESEVSSLFLKTGAIWVLAGVLSQGDSNEVSRYVQQVYELVVRVQDDFESEEWKSGSFRKLGMKIYRWVAILLLDNNTGENVLEDIIERLLLSLGDRETAVRFGASKSLAVISRKLDPEMAGDVMEAVMGIYEEDVFYQPSIAKEGQKRKKMFTAVEPEKWHGATLTLATFLRQRAVRETHVLERVVACIVEALAFEQRRSTFAAGGNVRDAACYAAWSLARNYTTAELHAAGGIVIPITAFEEPRRITQLLATELVVAACLDPLGNVRRAASAALQELVGRHPDCVKEGISLVQAVDYSAVALRRRSIIDVANHAAALDPDYWHGIVFGLVDGWRGIGSSDTEGRRLSAKSLYGLVEIKYAEDTELAAAQRGKDAFDALMNRIEADGLKDIEIYHGSLWALAELLDGLFAVDQGHEQLSDDEKAALNTRIFAKLKGRDMINPARRPELNCEAACRLIKSLCALVPKHFKPDVRCLRLWVAITEASLDRIEEDVLAQTIPASCALVKILPAENRNRIVEWWCTKIKSSLYRRQGHILALGEIMNDAPRHQELITEAVISAATRANQVELRVAGVKALGNFSTSDGAIFGRILDTVLMSLDDYASDLRGDVGSWVRLEAITAVTKLFADSTRCQAVSEETRLALAAKLVRLSVEKLDRVRLKASDALIQLAPALGPISAHLSQKEALATDVLSTSSRPYFSTLLTLSSVPEIRGELLSGYVTSAAAGSESLLKASRSAMLSFLGTAPESLCSDMATSLVTLLSANLASDRVLVPALQVTALLIEMEVLPLSPATAKKLFTQTQKAHFKSSNVGKLVAAVGVYRAIICFVEDQQEMADLKRDVLKKLCTILLHPFPAVRVCAAEALWVCLVAGPGEDEDQLEMLKAVETVDWTWKVGNLKDAVDTVRKGLGVDGK